MASKQIQPFLPLTLPPLHLPTKTLDPPVSQAPLQPPPALPPSTRSGKQPFYHAHLKPSCSLSSDDANELSISELYIEILRSKQTAILWPSVTSALQA